MDGKMLGDWLFYGDTKDFDKGPYYGEWLVFFSINHYDYVKTKCSEAVTNGVVKWAKHSTYDSVLKNHNGVLALKMESSDVFCVNGKFVSPKHQRVLRWLIDNNFVGKTKTGRYINIRFKLDSEDKGTHAAKEWQGFTLSDFLDVNTGDSLECNVFRAVC